MVGTINSILAAPGRPLGRAPRARLRAGGGGQHDHEPPLSGHQPGLAGAGALRGRELRRLRAPGERPGHRHPPARARSTCCRTSPASSAATPWAWSWPRGQHDDDARAPGDRHRHQRRDRAGLGRAAAWPARRRPGPAFEGAEITFGMRATDGAIEKVWIEDDVDVRTINNGRARGLCGSGLIDAVAEMLRVGLIDETGRLRVAPRPPRRRCRRRSGKRLCRPSAAMPLCWPGRAPARSTSRNRTCVSCSWPRAPSARASQILMKELGLSGHAEIAEVLLAGAFGSYVSPGERARHRFGAAVPVEPVDFGG